MNGALGSAAGQGLFVPRLFWLFVIALLTGCACPAGPIIDDICRPDNWAKVPKNIPDPKPSNFFEVNQKLFRSAKPTEDVIRNLVDKNIIKTVISLAEPDFTEKSISKVNFITVDTEYLGGPREKDVVKFLRIVLTPRYQPVLVHCERGSDRTGTMIAVYRIVVQGWEPEEAIREMTRGGYSFFLGWSPLCTYLRKELDADKIRSRVKELGPWGGEGSLDKMETSVEPLPCKGPNTCKELLPCKEVKPGKDI